MTAVLASIGLWGWVCALLGSSLIFALLIGGMIRRADDTERPAYPPPVVPSLCKIQPGELPAVPPTRSELAWLRDQPAEILRGQDLQWRFDDVVRGGWAA